jgi:hypothetical protein
VHDFRVELDRVEPSRLVGNRGERRALGSSDDFKSFRQLRHAVAVANPDLMALAAALDGPADSDHVH